jgi:hypothetical protein
LWILLLYLCNKIVKAYDVLHKYETGEVGDSSMDVVAPSAWGMEALGWTSTYEKITKRSIDDDAVTPPDAPLQFSAFASACVPPKNWMEAVFEVEAGGYEVFLSDSSKTRKELLVRIFQPLLGDVFSFNALNQIFEALGIRKRHGYLLKVSFFQQVGFSCTLLLRVVVFRRMVHNFVSKGHYQESNIC